MIITFLGYMGCGKTTLGKKVALRLKIPFFDLDAYIVDKERKSINTIFKMQGEEGFRALENLHLSDFLKNHKQGVLALGGGTPVFMNNLELIHQYSISIYIKSNPDVLTKRLWLKKEERPLISSLETIGELSSYVKDQLEKREIFYLKAKHIVQNDGFSKEEIIKKILDILKKNI